MTAKHPNKETIRRVCSMFKCESCWMLNEDNCKAPSLLVELDDNYLTQFRAEQEAWSGYLFDIYNLNSPSKKIEHIKAYGEMLMPVATDTPLDDIKMRQKPVRD